jgi:outer membrane protein assembly factor BamB
MFKAGPALQGAYVAPTPGRLVGVRFTFQAGGPIRSTPAVAGNALYVGSSDGCVYALDARDGRLLWRRRTGGGVTASPAIWRGVVYVSSRDGRLYALSAKNGALRWSFRFGPDLGRRNYWDFYMSSPVIAGGRLFIGGGDGALHAVDPASGRQLWRREVGARIRSTPAVAEGHVVFGTQAGEVIALDATTGAVRWRFETQGAAHHFSDKQNDTTSVYASPSVADGVVTVGGRDGELYGIALADGRQLWRTTHDGSSWILSTAIKADEVVVGSGSALILQGADLHTGAERWRVKTAGAVFASPAIAGDAVVYADISGVLAAVGLVDGRPLWRAPLGERIFASPVVAGDTVYVGTDADVLYAFQTAAAGPPATPIKRYVFFDPPKGDDDFDWFFDGIDVALDHRFEVAGYRRVDANALRAAMEAQVTGGGRAVVVFATNYVPPEVLDHPDARALIRRFLEAGGRAVFLGSNPVRFQEDASGAITALDGGPTEAVLGLRYPPLEEERGYHVSSPTAEGRRWGLRSMGVVNGAIRPGQVTTVLARNEFGLATAWTKAYGTRGGLLVQLAAAQRFSDHLDETVLAADHAAP